MQPHYICGSIDPKSRNLRCIATSVTLHCSTPHSSFMAHLVFIHQFRLIEPTTIALCGRIQWLVMQEPALWGCSGIALHLHYSPVAASWAVVTRNVLLGPKLLLSICFFFGNRILAVQPSATLPLIEMNGSPARTTDGCAIINDNFIHGTLHLKPTNIAIGIDRFLRSREVGPSM